SREGARHDPVDHARGARLLEDRRDLVQRLAGGHHVVDHRHARPEERARALEGAAHVAATLLIGQVHLRRRVALAHAKVQLQFFREQRSCNLDRLVVAAAAQAGGRERNRDHAIHAGVRQASPEYASEIFRQRKLAAKLERMHQRVGGKLVGERGNGGVVLRRLGQAAPAKLAARRVERAARAARTRQARQVGVARRAQHALGRAAAQEAVAAEPPRQEIPHKLGFMWTVAQLAADLAAGRTTSRRLTELALARIADPKGEGARAFIKVYAESALADADFSDRLRKGGVRRSPVEGLPASVKDLFDVAGDVTRAGSKVHHVKAENDAPAIARLRAAGAVLVGRTNMVEFAFGTTGLNPHYGTPKNPWDRATGRVPGGSSSGAGVAQADGMCVMALGTDTRGSIRIPSALCGVTGFKPTARRVPRDGAFPLSYTLDSIGPLANSVACCATYDALLAGAAPQALPELPVKGLHFLLPKSEVRDGLDPEVETGFQNAMEQLKRAGALVTERPVPAFDRSAEYFKGGGYAGAEAYAIHRKNADRLGDYDPR